MTDDLAALKVSDPQRYNPEECRLSKATAQTILTCIEVVDALPPLGGGLDLVLRDLNSFEMFRAKAIMCEVLDSDTEPFNDRFPWHGEHPPVIPSNPEGIDN